MHFAYARPHTVAHDGTHTGTFVRADTQPLGYRAAAGGTTLAVGKAHGCAHAAAAVNTTNTTAAHAHANALAHAAAHATHAQADIQPLAAFITRVSSGYNLSLHE